MDSIYLSTPIGFLNIKASSVGVVSIDFLKKKSSGSEMPIKNIHLKKATRELQEYFEGERLHFSLALDSKGTDFQKKVWRALQQIPFGETCTYGEVAKRIKQPNAARAVGMANNRNPLPIVVPCHRVIGKSGELVGYAGGMKIKKWLLAHESQMAHSFSVKSMAG